MRVLVITLVSVLGTAVCLFGLGLVCALIQYGLGDYSSSWLTPYRWGLATGSFSIGWIWFLSVSFPEESA